mmetsp:Transcript_8790/g.18787  ORF Transcript_8790/g.18787 Transcript_8790/m.18787 type:complete len:186 (+) Transcript_8790:164-721(+)|eukprot:CAMPEP_0202894652 /NCGR_PEP_ID=MMETSP1392-20130828/4009_1 /ASSEMBLY_ACC=CAM_ASM_000868 /TAXON_ID=225041 /ORGANISM="Chlamydomonas chlamydogama, Strain SAG 11-48b" /LENGTH=185 /DNA_ID=CAMNT_0049579407 /DNA_START=149 /DNA_END=706 /DNA_ORIENTATION=-
MPSNQQWERITPEIVLSYQKPTDDYLCPLSANIYGIEFNKFEVKDYDSGETVYASPSDIPTDYYVPDENLIRSVQYTFPDSFLTFKTVRTMLEFKVGPQPLNNFRMIELHYFKNKVVRVYDFTFGFCIPNSTNTWEAIYDVPEYSKSEVADYVNNPFAHKSDSFYFVDDKLVMHNKAEYQYVSSR